MFDKRNQLKTLSLAAALLASATLVSADQTDPKSGDLNNYLCRDILLMSGTDRDISIGIFHGYMLGKKNTTKYDSAKLSKVTDQALDYCLDNPNARGLDAFMKAVQ